MEGGGTEGPSPDDLSPLQRRLVETEGELAASIKRERALVERERALVERAESAEGRLVSLGPKLRWWARVARVLERSRTWRLAGLLRAARSLLRRRGSDEALRPGLLAGSIEASLEAVESGHGDGGRAGEAGPEMGAEAEAARSAMRDRDWDRASGLRQAIVDRSDDPPAPAYLELARAHRSAGRLREAQLAVESGLARFPQAPKLHVERAEIAMAARDWERAIVLWRSAIARFGDELPKLPFRRLGKAMGESASAETPRGFHMFGGYLCRAMVDPVVPVPAAEPEARLIGVMDSRRRQLVGELTESPPALRVSVIMPTKDRLDQIGKAIESVRTQSYGNWELIVVDDGGDDGTAEYVEGLGDERIRVHRLRQSRGAGGARNFGLSVADGDLIAYLDSDNMWHRDHLLVMAGAFEAEPDLGLAYCAQEIWKVAPSGEPRLSGVRFAPFNRSLLENTNYIDINAVVHTASMVDLYGGFNDSLPKLEDWELILRYTSRQGALAVPCVLGRYFSDPSADRLANLPTADDVREGIDAAARGPELEIATPDPGDGTTFARPRALSSPLSEAPPRPTTIVVPSFEAAEYLRACVESVLAYTPLEADWSLLVVDNGSGPQVQEQLDELAANERVEAVRFDRQLGFTRAVNIGTELAGSGRDILLLNNDALVTPGWIEGLWDVLSNVADAGVVVPRQVLVPGIRKVHSDVPAAAGSREVDVSLSASTANVVDPYLDWRRGYVELSFAPFFCVLLGRELIEEVGPLNADHGPHYRSDRLYCDMARHFAGRRVVYTPHSKVYHFHNRATKELKEAEPEGYRRLVGVTAGR